MFERWEVGGASWDDIRTIYAEVFITIVIAIVMLLVAEGMGII